MPSCERDIIMKRLQMKSLKESEEVVPQGEPTNAISVGDTISYLNNKGESVEGQVIKIGQDSVTVSPGNVVKMISIKFVNGKSYSAKEGTGGVSKSVADIKESITGSHLSVEDEESRDISMFETRKLLKESEAATLVSFDEDKFAEAMLDAGCDEDSDPSEYLEDQYGIADGEDYQWGNGLEIFIYNDSISKMGSKYDQMLRDCGGTVSSEK